MPSLRRRPFHRPRVRLSPAYVYVITRTPLAPLLPAQPRARRGSQPPPSRARTCRHRFRPCCDRPVRGGGGDVAQHLHEAVLAEGAGEHVEDHRALPHPCAGSDWPGSDGARRAGAGAAPARRVARPRRAAAVRPGAKPDRHRRVRLRSRRWPGAARRDRQDDGRRADDRAELRRSGVVRKRCTGRRSPAGTSPTGTAGSRRRCPGTRSDSRRRTPAPGTGTSCSPRSRGRRTRCAGASRRSP